MKRAGMREGVHRKFEGCEGEKGMENGEKGQMVLKRERRLYIMGIDVERNDCDR